MTTPSRQVAGFACNTRFLFLLLVLLLTGLTGLVASTSSATTTGPVFTYDMVAHSAQATATSAPVVRVLAGSHAQARAPSRGTHRLQSMAGVAAEAGDGPIALGPAAEALSPGIRALSEANLTGSGTTVLGRHPGYVAKAEGRGASYFDIGDAWNALTPAQRTGANNHFLDVIAQRGDRVLLSTPKGDIGGAGTLADEIAYLTGPKGYVWVNQWSLRPGG